MRKIFSIASFLLTSIACYHAAEAFSFKKNYHTFTTYTSVNDTPLRKIVRRIAKANAYVVTSLNNNNKAVSDQELNYRDLLKVASPEELSDLAASDKNAIVRLYAFKALMETEKDAPKNIFEQFMNDATLIKVINGSRSEMKPLNSISNGFLY